MSALSTTRRSARWLPPFRQSLSWKLGVSYFLLIFVNTLIACALLVIGFRETVITAEQYTHWEAAQSLVPEVERILSGGEDFDTVAKYFYQVIKLNPTIDPFLLDEHGNIQASVNQKSQLPAVDIRPIEIFLNHHGFPGSPVRGQDPLNIYPGWSTAFSAAEVRAGDNKKYLYVVTSSKRARNAFQTLGDFNAFRAAAFMYFSMIPLSALVGYVVWKFFSRKLYSIGAAVAKFGDGDYSARIEVNSGDEVGLLADTINTMASKLESAMAQLDRADRARRELLANLSHDMRHPVATMRAALERLSAQEKLEPENASPEVQQRRALVAKTLSSCDTLGSYVGRLFELARLSDPQYTVSLEPIPIVDVVDSVAMSQQNAASAKSITLTVDAADDLPAVLGDVHLIERAIMNLTVNAIAHTPPDGSVKLSASVKNNLMEISVSDTGPGIPAGDVPHLFDRFYRSAKTAKAGGTGLGLAIVKKVSDLHGTEPSIESTEGAGSKFTLRLKLA